MKRDCQKIFILKIFNMFSLTLFFIALSALTESAIIIAYFAYLLVDKRIVNMENNRFT